MAFERRLSKRMLAELKEWQERNLEQKNEQDDEQAWLKNFIEDETIWNDDAIGSKKSEGGEGHNYL